MAFTGPLEDRIAIRELYDAYADGANRGDKAAWLDPWAEDAYWWTHYFEVQGKDAVAATYDQTVDPARAVTFMTQICSIEVDGDAASARAVCQERLVLKTGGSMRLTGLYEDELVRRDGRWLFHRRIYKVITEEVTPD